MKKSQINVLIVDDEESVRNSLSAAIKQFGYKPTVAAKSEEAVNLARIKPIHMAIVDCVLPKKNGVEVCRELRITQFGNSPIVLMSGIFKDKSFAVDAMRKTGAKEFIHKPFDLQQLKKLVNKNLAHLIDEPKIPLHTLLSKPFASNRERMKALGSVEEINGLDLPFVLSILMHSGSSGHLNIVNVSGELYGIDFKEGSVAKVDSSESAATLSLLLMKKGFVTTKDLEEFSKEEKRGDLVKNLVEENFISPHALPIIKLEQIFSDLRRLFVKETMQINFVPAEVKDAGIEVGIEKIIPLFNDATDTSESNEFLRAFYRPWCDYPIQLGPQFKANRNILELDIVKRVPGIKEQVEAGRTINEIQQDRKCGEVELLKALHMMALMRMIVFDDVKRDKNTQKDYYERMISIEASIKGKNPFEVFNYFGIGDNPKVTEVEKIYKEFAKSNHPDMLPPDASEALQRVTNSVFSIVSNAADVLMDEKRKKELLAEIKSEEARRQMEAEQMTEEALVALRRGKAQAAEKSLKKAYDLYSSRTILIYLIWARIKVRPSLSQEVQAEIGKQLDSFPVEERRNAVYNLVSGIYKRAIGDLFAAKSHFEKALHFDPHFMDARRELSALRGSRKKKSSLLNADLGGIVGGLFKKKAD